MSYWGPIRTEYTVPFRNDDVLCVVQIDFEGAACSVLEVYAEAGKDIFPTLDVSDVNLLEYRCEVLREMEIAEGYAEREENERDFAEDR